MMRIVLENLMGNAGKYSSKTTSPVVELFLAGSDDQHLEFAVRDNGAGFDMAQAERLFQPYQRLHSSAQFQGQGLGLAIVQRIVTRHGGRVWAHSAPGQGTTVYFTLGAVDAPTPHQGI
jgi:signal transduction histidine kinase